MWYLPYEKLDEVKCKKHPKYKVMREPRVPCNDCWVAWVERNLQVDIRGENKDFIIKAMHTFAKQNNNQYIYETPIEELVEDSPECGLIKGT